MLDPDTLAKVLDARRVTIPEKVIRIGADLTFRAHLQPAPPGWVDMGLAVPTMDTTRAKTQLGWTPRVDAPTALRELLAGMREPSGLDTPPLRPRRRRPAPPPRDPHRRRPPNLKGTVPLTFPLSRLGAPAQFGAALLEVAFI